MLFPPPSLTLTTVLGLALANILDTQCANFYPVYIDGPKVPCRPWSAEEMLDGRRQRVDILSHAAAAHNGLSQKTEKVFLLNRPSCPPDDPIGQETKLN